MDGRKMVKMEDFRLEDGNIDWRALRAAEIESGQRCYECYTYIHAVCISYFPGKEKVEGRQLCYDCRQMKESDDNVSHSENIRCPKCGHVEQVDYEITGIYEDGEHEVWCGVCEHDYKVCTDVSYTFTSPARIK
jgi:hypothetical protein